MLTLLGNYSVVNKLNVSTEKVKKKKKTVMAGARQDF